ncbi:hypothetical protein [Deinococcus petrolearius]|uniref:Uncharacterized protein n=1 Tax=Deinococcus petrolearius TaxID=1751295 RepID=A0ABW1DMR8_9DEIO
MFCDQLPNPADAFRSVLYFGDSIDFLEVFVDTEFGTWRDCYRVRFTGSPSADDVADALGLSSMIAHELRRREYVPAERMTYATLLILGEW